MPRRVLVIDDDPTILRILEHTLRRLGLEVTSGRSGAELWRQLDGERPDLVLLDLVLPDADGIDLLAELRRRGHAMPVIVMTAHGSIAKAVEAMRQGAYDFLEKPINPQLLELTVRKAADFQTLTEEVAVYRRAFSRFESCGEMIGRHPSMQFLYAQIENVAPSDVSVLITGESGAGKELVARALHAKSKRAPGPFVDINCAAIPHELLESEMFGHEKGAFTGAYRQYAGCFERADGGTLFLDEITEMNPQLQAKLLRVLQDGRFSRVGGDQRILTDVRIVSSTNRGIDEALAGGKLREDVYYRLNVVQLRVPPLRERRGDIALLARHYLEQFARLHDKPFEGFTESALQALTAAPWKGNVRELVNVVQQAVVLNAGRTVTLEMLPAHVQAAAHAPVEALEPANGNGEVLPFWLTEKLEIEKALRLTDFSVSDAARKLQLSQATLYRKIQKYGLEKK